ncbi:hypothetical protein [Rubripirellula amarantea]|uniref:hypothetical protein n=1 Tax=Rubripirellula amarantea TaxID=2527999 RepID=UPI0013EF2BA2|nr:hypothetical protein [Rubripirellula amarantea]
MFAAIATGKDQSLPLAISAFDNDADIASGSSGVAVNRVSGAMIHRITATRVDFQSTL